MLRTMTIALATTAASLGALVATASVDDASAQDYVIRYASPSAITDPTQEAVQWFMDEVEARTDGRVEFETFLGQALVQDQDIVDAVGDGLIEMGKIYTVSYPAQLPLWQIGNLPFTHPAPYVLMNTIHGLREQFPEMDQEMEAQGVKAFGVITTGGTELVSNRELTSLEDLEGLQVRARGVQALAFTAAGASPASIPWNDVYEALSRGVVDASTNYIMAVGPIRHNEVSDYFIRIGLGQALQVEIINDAFWNSLPEDLQEIMTETMREAEERFFREINAIAVNETDRLGNAEGADHLEFITFPEDERQRWIEESPDFFAEWAEENAARADTEAMVEAFRRLQEEFTEKGDELGYTEMW